MLIANGYGVGSIVSSPSCYEAGDVTSVMTEESIQKTIKYNSYFECRNIKYGKQVKVSLWTYDGSYPEEVAATEYGDVVRVSGMRDIYLYSVNLGNGGEDSSGRGRVEIKNMPIGTERNDNAHKHRSYGWDRYSTLLAPSDEPCDVKDVLAEKFNITSRLIDSARSSPLF
jgi:hypothetical protein